MAPTILGVAGSLRNARWGAGNEKLVADLRACRGEGELREYLKAQGDLHVKNFLEAGRAEGLSFTEIYRNLQKHSGDRGLSNTEVALAAGLWGAWQSGCEIRHLSLSEFFPAAGRTRRLDHLKPALLSADGLLVSGPVYFGDRGSLVQELVDFIRDDPELREGMRDKVYAGIAVGAKRNGGQETTLIYQLMDMVTLGFLGVGNDSDTTAQYGGTGHAGDVGTMVGDEYGLWTSLGTGRRIARVATLAMLGETSSLRDKVRIAFWILQDRDEIASRFVKELVAEWAHEMEAVVIDVTGRSIVRCIACDLCPTHIDVDHDYRCVIHGRQDELESLHGLLLDCDAIVPVAYSPADRRGLVSNYQRFIERTRYLRHADYGLGDCLTAPLVIEEVGVLQNMHIRMATSLLRHHTVITEPMVTYVHQGQMLNAKETRELMGRFVGRTKLVTAGRLQAFFNENGHGAAYTLSKYNPAGYVLSAEKDKEDEKVDARGAVVRDRQRRLAIDASRRLVGADGVVGDRQE